MLYAGFWKRVVANFIDGIVVALLTVIVSVLWSFINRMFLTTMLSTDDYTLFPSEDYLFVSNAFIPLLIYLCTMWLYFALMESSSKKATLGKMMLGIIVVDSNNQKLSFWRASGRYFAKNLSGLTMYIGFLMAAFTEKKQTLHDMIARAYVVNKEVVNFTASAYYQQHQSIQPQQPQPIGKGYSVYSGFWKRSLAFLVDSIIIYPVIVIVSLIIQGVKSQLNDNLVDDSVLMLVSFGRSVIIYAMLWLYYGLLESSSWQGTIGKKAMGIIVVDGANSKLTFLRASGRHWAKVLSILTLCIGYIMAGFTAKKQALHDKAAGVYVVNRMSPNQVDPGYYQQQPQQPQQG
ncbi:RDD family protein [Paenibacillus sp. NPDC058174]|uniref:RDD family protein n=1 Tax=Paenibacillus sp. NPDC058174 TaxID=3346366 RepID=UPI0036DF26D4